MARKRMQVDLSPTPSDKERLDRLYTGSSGAEQTAGMDLLALRLDAVQPDANQPRKHFDDQTLNELADSMREQGVIQPIEVTQIGPTEYQIVHGERRWRAAQLAGLETIPAVVRRRDYDPPTRLVRQLIENIQREDLNDVDRANALVELRRQMQLELDQTREVSTQVDTSPWASKVTWADIGQRVGLSRQRIHQIIRLLELPEAIQEDIRSGQTSEKETRPYHGISAEKQEELHTARQTESLDSDQVRQAAEMLRREDTMPAEDAIAAVQEFPPRQPEPETLPHPKLDERQTESAEIRRLMGIRRHLANFTPDKLPTTELHEALRLLESIQSEVTSIVVRLQEREGTRDV